MNNILAELENLSMEELTYLFEYLVELINQRKREEEMQDKALQRSNAKWTKYGFFITLISALLGLLYFLWENIL